MTERGPNGPTCVQVKLNGFFLLIVGHPWDKKGHRAAHILLLERYVWSKYEGSSDWTQLTDSVWMIDRLTAQGRIDLVTWCQRGHMFRVASIATIATTGPRDRKTHWLLDWCKMCKSARRKNARNCSNYFEHNTALWNSAGWAGGFSCLF